MPADMKLDELIKEAEAHYQEITNLNEKKRDLDDQIQEVSGEALTAAYDGDTDLYKRLQQKVNDLKIEQTVCNARLKKLQGEPAVDLAAAQTAWREFAKRKEAAMKKKLADLEKAKDQLYSIYGELIENELQIMDTRKKIGEYVLLSDGTDPNNEKRLADEFPAISIPLKSLQNTNPAGLLSIGGINTRDPDCVYFLSCYIIKNNVQNPMWTDPMYEKVRRIINNQH